MCRRLNSAESQRPKSLAARLAGCWDQMAACADAPHTRRRLCKHRPRPELEPSVLQRSDTTGGWDVDEARAIHCFSFWQGQLTTGSSLSPSGPVPHMSLADLSGLQVMPHELPLGSNPKIKNLQGLEDHMRRGGPSELNNSHVIKRPFV